VCTAGVQCVLQVYSVCIQCVHCRCTVCVYSEVTVNFSLTGSFVISHQWQHNRLYIFFQLQVPFISVSKPFLQTKWRPTGKNYPNFQGLAASLGHRGYFFPSSSMLKTLGTVCTFSICTKHTAVMCVYNTYSACVYVRVCHMCLHINRKVMQVTESRVCGQCSLNRRKGLIIRNKEAEAVAELFSMRLIYDFETSIYLYGL
jgi:hypothetical protein